MEALKNTEIQLLQKKNDMKEFVPSVGDKIRIITGEGEKLYSIVEKIDSGFYVTLDDNQKIQSDEYIAFLMFLKSDWFDRCFPTLNIDNITVWEKKSWF